MDLLCFNINLEITDATADRCTDSSDLTLNGSGCVQITLAGPLLGGNFAHNDSTLLILQVVYS